MPTPPKQLLSLPIAAAALAGVIAILLPVHIGDLLFERQARQAEFARLDGLAAEMLRRSEATRGQLLAAVDELQRAGLPACSEDDMDAMRRIDAHSTYLQAVGRVEGDRLICSSMGSHDAGIELGPGVRGGSGIRSWIGVELPLVPGVRLNVYEKDGIASVVHPDLVMDLLAPGAPEALAVLALQPLRIVRSRGPVDAAWLKQVGGSSQFSDGRYMVAIRYAKTPYVAALAAAPVPTRTAGPFWVLAPIGLLCGALLAAAVFYATRQFLSDETALKAALRRREFFLLYQPIVALDTGRCVGAEALVRWRRRDGRLMPPDLFIPLAEASGLILELTRQVLDMALRDLAPLLRGQPELHVAVNFSALDLEQADLAEQVRRQLAAHGVAPQQLVVEATERGLMNAERARKVLDALRALPAKVAIDDFGVGYSSLTYLETFRVDYLKIDKSFVDTMGGDAATSQVAPHIIEMARTLGLEMIAEGVETAAQRDFLQQRGVQFAQGWHFAKPMPAAELAAFVDARRLG